MSREPTTGVDRVSRRERWLSRVDGSLLALYLASLAVVVLHDIEQAARLADRMVALKNGEIRARGPPEEVVTETLLAEVFEIDANVDHTPRGPRTKPLRACHNDPTGPTA